MPSIKDFDKKAKKENIEKSENIENTKKSENSQNAESGGAPPAANSNPRAKRRPGRGDLEHEDQSAKVARTIIEPSQEDVTVVDVETGEQIQAESVATEEVPQAMPSKEGAGQPPLEEGFKIVFPGSDLIKNRFPRPFAVAEAVATDWVNDGRFEGLPLGHPLLQYFAAKGLQAAKDFEKKIANSPVTEKVAFKAFEVGLKAQATVGEMKTKIEELRAKVIKK